ncbi:MAG: FAD-binding protein [Deltaproteobacteria bacterium]|nr:FAD-binding protein [Deltaproteobacteria bacterium]
MISPDHLNRLRRIVGEPYVSSGRADTEVYSYDASPAFHSPGAVVFPAETREVAAVAQICSEARIPFVPRGFGTNLSGGCVAPAGGLIVCLSRMNRILSIKTESRTAELQPGVTNLELQNALAPLGFFYAPDPASQKVATLGGNVGENSGGPRCLKYGVTKNHVLGLELVLPDGEIVRVGGAALDPAGYDIRGAVIGSEGTLGIVTEIIVRILPLPESVVTLLAIYDDVSAAARTVSKVIEAGILPATLEMMDATVMRAVEESYPCGYPLDAAAVLIIEVDGPVAGLTAQAGHVREICMKNGCRNVRRAKDNAERDRLWAGRRGAFGAVARLAPNFSVMDCTVPRTLLPEALSRVADLAKRHGLAVGNVFHAGDGNLHPLLLFDSRDRDQLRRVRLAGWGIMEACVALGGTISGEHGVGEEKIEAMRMVFSEDDLDAQRALKNAFDPHHLLNPHKVLPERLEREAPLEPPGIDPQGRTGLAPVDAGEACRMVRQAFNSRVSLDCRGAGRHGEFGNPSVGALIPLSSERMSGVVECDPDNQFITVGAGTLLSALQERLGENKQWLPLRPPHGERHTVGGVVALGACGPERFRYGAPRDLLLGLRFVSGTGRLISTGGKVIKNVAGYELGSLLVGSAGTLGFITELTFRVSPLPETCLALSACGSFERTAAAAAELFCSKLEPAFLTATPADNGQAGGSIASKQGLSWRITVGFEGFRETVTEQEARCSELFVAHELGDRATKHHKATEDVHAPLCDLLNRSEFLLRVDLPSDGLRDYVSAAFEIVDIRNVLVDFGCGRILFGVADLSERQWRRLGDLAGQSRGHALIEKATDAFRLRNDVFGPFRPEWKVTHAIKEALDPGGIFAPGRLPGRK